MARIRSIHPSLFTDEAYMELSMSARVLLPGVWTECDDQGVFAWKPLTLKARLMPADNIDIGGLMFELTRGDFIKKFSDAGKDYGAVRNFGKFQRPKKPVLVHPLPDELRAYVALDQGEESLRRRKHDEQEGKCFYCATAITYYSKRSNSLEIDRRIPVSRGGNDDEDNFVAACRTCNRAKGAMTDSEFAEWRIENASSGAKRRERTAKVALSQATEQNRAAKAEGMFQREDGGGNREEEKEWEKEKESSLRSLNARAPEILVEAKPEVPAPAVPQPTAPTDPVVEIPDFLRRFPDDLKQFLQAFPHTGQGPEEVLKAWKWSEKIRPPLGAVLAAVANYVATIARENAARPADNQRQPCHASRWLREKRWEAFGPLPERPKIEGDEEARSRARRAAWGGHPAVATLCAELGEGLFDSWFAVCRLTVVDGLPILHAPSRLVRDTLASKHMDRLEAAFVCAVAIELNETKLSVVEAA